ncbi:conserved hypothetical protein [Trichinella spiralis]|uniref:hypothetical protein n=1 Tax=Trichinella spiralis TaxID=6334 RepID=UPI0001EFC90B|nr:conserved hypothetical protein [Trichinella spiralis]
MIKRFWAITRWPFLTIWWPRTIMSMSILRQNDFTTSTPNFVQVPWNAAVHAEDSPADQCRQGHVVEGPVERVPNFIVLVTFFNFISESFAEVDVRKFMISPQEENVMRIADFVQEQQAQAFQRLFAPVDQVAQK